MTNQNTKKRICFVIGLNVIALLLSLIVFKPFFEENDDLFLSMICEGAFGKPDYHMIYTNVILGRVLVAILSIFPSIRAFISVQYILIFISYCFICYYLCEKKYGYFYSFILVIATFYECYVSFQYTKSGTIVTIAGYLLLFEAVALGSVIKERTSGGAIKASIEENTIKAGTMDEDCTANSEEYYSTLIKRKRIVFWIAGTFLALMGFMIRDEAFMLASIPALILGIYIFLSDVTNKHSKAYDINRVDNFEPTFEKSGSKNIAKEETKNIEDKTNDILKKCVKILPQYIKVFAPAFILIITSFAIDKYSYKTDAGWDWFMNYNEIRTDLVDDRADLFDTTVFKDELEKIGVSENDAFIYITWQFGDDSVFNEELMQKMLDIRPIRAMGMAFVKAFVAHCHEEFYSKYAIYVGFLILFIIGIMGILGYSKKDRLLPITFMILNLIAIFAILFYFEFAERWNHRILGALFIPFSFTTIYFLTKIVVKKEILNNSFCILVSVILLAINLGLILSNRFDYNAYKRNEPNPVPVYEYVAEHKDNFFVLDTFTFQNINKYNIFDAFRAGSLENAMVIGSWYANSPITKQVTRKFGFENPYEALAKSQGNVILIDNLYPERKAEYLSEHYDGEYVMQEIEVPELTEYTCYVPENVTR